MLLRLIISAYFITTALAAFITTQKCNLNTTNFKLAPFIVDVRLNQTSKLLLFLISTKVVSNYTTVLTGVNVDSDKNIAISDVNATTNTYTTLLVDIDFMGKTFISDRLRFCDYVAVKNTSGVTYDPRLPDYVPPVTPLNTNPDSTNSKRSKLSLEDPSLDFFDGFPNYKLEKWTQFNEEKQELPQLDPRSVQPSGFLELVDNTTVQAFFKNATGDLIQCPLYFNDSILIYYEANVSQHYHHLGSYTVTFSVIDNNIGGDIIGYTQMYVTPTLSRVIQDTILYGVIVLLAVTFVVNFFIIICSSYQESSNPFLNNASTFCNSKLLKQLDTNSSRIIIYLQFALFIGGLDLQYPGFYQPMIGQLKWCALLGTNFFYSRQYHKKPHNGTTHNFNGYGKDNIYMTLNSGGIKSLTSFISDPTSYDIWPNFMVCFACWLIIQAVVQQLFLVFKFFSDKYAQRVKNRDSLLNSSGFEIFSKKNLYFIIGQVFHSYLHLFAYPLLIMTTYMFYITAKTLNKKWYIPSIEKMAAYAFSFTTPYDAIYPRACGIPHSNSVEHGARLSRRSFNSSLECHGSVISAIPTYQAIVGSFILTFWVALAGFFIFYFIFNVQKFKIVRSRNVSKLYTSIKSILLWSYLYNELHPEKIYYVAVDLTSILIESIIIGAFQSLGFVQVILLVIVRVAEVLLMLLINPYFVKLSWISSRSWITAAKVVVTFLCIPYIRELQISEAARTYVAYVQLLIHTIVALFFILNLIIGLASTIIAIMNSRKENKSKYNNEIITNSLEDFNREFEYQPITYPLNNNYIEEKDVFSTGEDFDDSKLEFYYRGKTEPDTNEKLVDGSPIECNSIELTYQNAKRKIQKQRDYCITDDGYPCDIISLDSFLTQQKLSNIRKRNNNYCVREGDNVYKKYFINDSIDPEVKALWESRSVWEDVRKVSKPTLIQKAETFMPNKFFKKPPTESGFQVSRPRKLVVRTLSEIRAQQKDSATEVLPALTSENEFDFTYKSS